MSNFGLIPHLVDYSSDEEQQEELEIKNIHNNCKSERDSMQITKTYESNISRSNACDILPLPLEIKSMYVDNNQDNIIDDPVKHGGKIRSFPHERGVWASYVYIEYTAMPEFLEMIEDLKNISKKYGIILNCIEEMHVSVSRTLKLRHHWIQPLIESLKTSLRPLFKFKIQFQSLEVYENEERTRTFIGMKVHYGFDNLNKITRRVDSCLAEFKLPLFYDNPSFHLSCLSCIGSKVEEIEIFMADLNAVFQSFAESYPDCRSLDVKNIFCKCGNKFFTFPLKS